MFINTFLKQLSLLPIITLRKSTNTKEDNLEMCVNKLIKKKIRPDDYDDEQHDEFKLHLLERDAVAFVDEKRKEEI